MANKAHRFIADTSDPTEYSELRLQSVMRSMARPRRTDLPSALIRYSVTEIVTDNNDVNHKRARKQ